MTNLRSFIKKNTAQLEALMPFAVALSLLVFAFIPNATQAASTTYYVDIPNLGNYGVGGAVSYICNNSNCSVNGMNGNGSYSGSNNPYGTTGYGNGQSNTTSSQYPQYAYQYYKNPNPGATSNGSNSGSTGSTATPYVPMKANYTPYEYPLYAQYVRQADGTYKLSTPKTPPAYAWNADNSLPSSTTGYSQYGQYGSPYYGTGSGYGSGGFIPTSGYGTGYGSGYPTGSTGSGFTMTSSNR